MQLDDLLTRGKPTPSCLSAWQRSQLCIGTLTGAAAASAQAHVATCSRCRDALAEERAEVAAAAYETVPEALQRAFTGADIASGRRGPWLWRLLGGLVVAATVAGVALLVRPTVSTAPTVADTPTQPQARTRLKGPPALDLSLSIMRAGELMAHDERSAAIPVLEPGDRVRVRVHTPRAGWIVFEGREGAGWAEYYRGAEPADRWLPFGVAITPAGETQFRLTHCDVEPAEELSVAVEAGQCRQRVFRF